MAPACWQMQPGTPPAPHLPLGTSGPHCLQAGVLARPGARGPREEQGAPHRHWWGAPVGCVQLPLSTITGGRIQHEALSVSRAMGTAGSAPGGVLPGEARGQLHPPEPGRELHGHGHRLTVGIACAQALRNLCIVILFIEHF